MDKTKQTLNIALSLSIILCSLSIFIISIKGTTAIGQISTQNGFQAVGVVNGGIDVYDVIGFNAKTGETKILAKGKY